VVDFNGDGIVDIKDLLRVIESWGQDNPAVDIGPTAFGDGKIDANDLEVLMRHWGQEVGDPTLLAHWKLDEASGITAADSAGTNPGTLIGGPVWQPTAGRIKGALQFDGRDDCVTTGFALDPSRGSFSVFAWVQGGAPGQVIVSQAAAADWLKADVPKGALVTELKGGGRPATALTSARIITDGAWHRVGFVWDGSNRVLYVDDTEVARDTQGGLVEGPGGLNIGASSGLTPGRFWSGMVDDIRIYNRAVKP
jgi:hypothetical protein